MIHSNVYTYIIYYSVFWVQVRTYKIKELELVQSLLLDPRVYINHAPCLCGAN